VAARRRADASALLGSNTVGGEALEQSSIRSEHADGSVAGPYYLGSDDNRLVEHPFQRQLGREEGARSDQPLEPML
jgi:hypothetical protein